MRNFIIVGVLCLAVGLAGCGKKEVAQAPAAGNRAHQLLLEGTVFLKQGDVRRAVESYAMSIKEAPDSFDAYFMLAQTFIHLKQYGQAQSVLSNAADRFPENPTLFYFLALSYQGTDNLMPAIVAARKSLDLFKARQDEDGEKRATILLGVLVQIARGKAEEKMVETATQAGSAVK